MRSWGLIAIMWAGGVAVADESKIKAEEGRPLKMEVIDQVIEKSDRQVQACNRQKKGDVLAVQMMLEIDADGVVTVAEPVDKPTPESQCLQKVSKKLHFPSTGVETKIAYPFMLLRR